MLLGDLIARLQDEGFADETLLATGDLVLAAQIASAAAAHGMTRGEFVAAAVGGFAAGCSDEEWLSVLGQMGRAEHPGQVLLRRAVAVALSNNEEPSAQSGPSHRRHGCGCGGAHEGC